MLEHGHMIANEDDKLANLTSLKGFAIILFFLALYKENSYEEGKLIELF